MVTFKYTTSIIIPTFGPRSPAMLTRTLNSITQCDLPKALTEIIVIENGQENGAKDICEFYKAKLPLSYYFSPIANVSLARNKAVEFSRGDFLIFFDDDIRLSSDSIRSYIEAFEQFGLAHFYGGPLGVDYEENPDPTLLPFSPPSVKGFSIGDQVVEISNATHLFLGANHAIPRHMFLQHGGYDSLGTDGLNSGGLGEEYRIQKQLLRSGITGIYIPTAMVWHYVPKEALTREWLKIRYYRHGLTYGIQLANGPKNVAKICSVPRYSIRMLLTNLFAQLRSVIRPISPHNKLKLCLEYHQIIGEINGFRKSLRDQKLTQSDS